MALLIFLNSIKKASCPYSESMISRVERGTHAKVLGDVTIPVLVVGVSSDLLYPLTSQQELSRLLPLSTLEIIDSEYGHDAFLIEFKKINNAIKRFRQTLQTVKNEKYNVST